MNTPNLQELLERQGYLTINGLVKYLREFHPEKAVSYPTIQRWTEKGILQYYKYGGQYRVQRSSIENLIKYGTDLGPEKLHPAPNAEGESEPKSEVVLPSQMKDPDPETYVDRRSTDLEPEPSLESLFGLSAEEQAALRSQLYAELPDEEPNDK